MTEDEKSTFLIVLLIALLFVMLTSCINPKAPGTTTKEHGDFTIKTIDECEYLEYENGFFDSKVYSLTHKGNCKNKIHKYGNL
jgi:PBP1b-binding outer membrane lipoprotein LpoB